MVETDLDSAVGCDGGAQQPFDLIDADPGGFLDEHVSAGRERPVGQLSQVIVDDRDDHHIGLEPQQFVERRARVTAVGCRQAHAALADRVEGADQPSSAPERAGALVADQPAARDRDTQCRPAGSRVLG